MRRAAIAGVVLLAVFGAGCFSRMVSMPGETYAGPQWLTQRLSTLGYTVKEEPFPVGERTVKNLIVEKTGASKPSELIVIGAHYDSARALQVQMTTALASQ